MPQPAPELPADVGCLVAREMLRLFLDAETPVRERIGLGKRLLAHIPAESWERLSEPRGIRDSPNAQPTQTTPIEPPSEFDRLAPVADEPSHVRPDAIEASSVSPAAPADADRPRPLRRDGPRIGRNARCPCGSGRKHKACCLRPSG